jgi:hypothetical protein
MGFWTTVATVTGAAAGAAPGASFRELDASLPMDEQPEAATASAAAIDRAEVSRRVPTFEAFGEGPGAGRIQQH